MQQVDGKLQPVSTQPNIELCCFFIKHGICDPPRPPCKYRHEADDNESPCSFGATCRVGHSTRVLAENASVSEKEAYWRKYNSNSGTVGRSPAVRDATLLRSQLEPWPTATLRNRLVTLFGESYDTMDPLGRAELMQRLLAHYESHGPRKTIRIGGTPVRQELCDKLLKELKLWHQRHKVNNRPSINAKSYMILRSPKEFTQKNSKKARMAARKLSKNKCLWELATHAMKEIDPQFADNFSALAVTYGFNGSPHIDKQNTGPFYGLALGDFPDGQGSLCVESDPFVIAHVNTKNRLGKVDGRFPHWVSPYDPSTTRFSLIYYSTLQHYEKATSAYFGPIIDEKGEILS